MVFQEFEHGDAESKKELNKLFEAAQAGDTIITLEVSRLTRSTKQLCELVERVKEKHLCLQIVGSITIDCRSGDLDPMTAAFLQMAGVFSELELKMIRARVKSGMANARAKGKQIGRPRITRDSLPENFYKHYPLYSNHSITKAEYARLLDISRPTLDHWLSLAKSEAK
jgi:DNA invertase Pin-like site-specific DNA recombinase